MNEPLLRFVNRIKHNPIYNYITPGLTSWMIREYPDNGGMVRLFEMTRVQMTLISPHSHRFDFKCTVLQGRVSNVLWRKTSNTAGDDWFVPSTLIYQGEQGKYKLISGKEACYYGERAIYDEHDKPHYAMKHDEIHSIVFEKGAVVLFEEGPKLSDRSIILDPWDQPNGRIPLSDTQPWMFNR